jgi:hypothetical protein
VPVAIKFWVKPSFKFGGLAGEIAKEVNAAVDLGVVVVFDDEDDFVVVIVVIVAITVLEEEACVSVVVDGDFDVPHADKPTVKIIIKPITRQ